MGDPFFSYYKMIERELAGLLPAASGEAELREWARRAFGEYSPQGASPHDLGALLEALRSLYRRGGKRWRPLLLLLSCELVGGGAEAALPLAGLAELAHTGSLIIDDVEDGAVERRGGPALHVEKGLDVALNAGCLLYFLPLAALEDGRLASGLAAEATRIFGLHLRRLHLGQALDIEWHRDDGRLPSREEYFMMCRMKTGCLSGMSARLGATAGFGAANGLPLDLADAARVAELGAIAEDAGVAFQLLDDARNLLEGLPGKRRGDDVVEGKKSLPYIIMRERDPGLAGRIAGLFSRARAEGPDSPAVGEFISLARETGAAEAAAAEGRAMIARAIRRLEGAWPASQERDRLRALFERIG